jgi:hypothetical protein
VLKLPNRIVDGKAVKCDATILLSTSGAEAFEKHLKGSDSGIDIQAALCKPYDLSKDEEKIEFLKKTVDNAASNHKSVERKYMRAGCEAAGVSPQTMLDEVRRAGERKKTEDKNVMKDLQRRSARTA